MSHVVLKICDCCDGCNSICTWVNTDFLGGHTMMDYWVNVVCVFFRLTFGSMFWGQRGNEELVGGCRRKCSGSTLACAFGLQSVLIPLPLAVVVPVVATQLPNEPFYPLWASLRPSESSPGGMGTSCSSFLLSFLAGTTHLGVSKLISRKGWWRLLDLVWMKGRPCTAKERPTWTFVKVTTPKSSLFLLRCLFGAVLKWSK